MHKFEFISKSIDLTSVRIEGWRVTLLSIDESFGQSIFQEFTPEITRYMFPKPARRIEETLAFISQSLIGMRAGWNLVLAITKASSGEFLGCCGLHGKDSTRSPELGIWVKKNAHGYLYGREAITNLVKWTAENINFDFLVYPVDKANIPSRKIPESFGGIIYKEKIVKTMSGGILDEVIYTIPAESLRSKQFLINHQNFFKD